MNSLGCMSVRQSHLEHFLEILTCHRQWGRLIKGNKRRVARRLHCAEKTTAANLQMAKSALCSTPAQLPVPPTQTFFLGLILQTFHYRHLLFSAYLEESIETTFEAGVTAVTGALDANWGPLEGWHRPFLILCPMQGQAADCSGSEWGQGNAN